MPRALLSVSDKTGLIPFAKTLRVAGWELVASGGTAQALTEAEIDVITIETVTGQGEMLGGRVKTLHPAIHAGILARDHSQDKLELEQANFTAIDLVVCNLYPFQKTIAKPEVTLEQAIDKIDIGGVTLVRAAAKNFERVVVVVDPTDYIWVSDALVDGKLTLQQRRQLATKAFAHTRDYDTSIYAFLAEDESLTASDTEQVGETFSLALTRVQELRYGENPHQHAALYARQATTGPLTGTLLQGKPLSYNNLLDADAAWRAVSACNPDNSAAVVIVKHLNPTGIAVGETLAQAFEGALASDPVSAFGGIVAVNQRIDQQFVNALGSLFVEVIIAPEIDPSAQEMLASGRKNCRVLTVPQLANSAGIELRSILGGVLLQNRDLGDPPETNWQVVTQRHPTADETTALQFAWKAVQHVKSNSIVFAGKTATFGIGGGLPSRVDAVYLAASKAGDNARGAVLASDAFFPMTDGVQAAIDAGVTAIIQPGGSIRDQEVIATADTAGIAMVLTKVRHFRH